MTTHSSRRSLSAQDETLLYRLWPAEAWPRLLVLAVVLLVPLIFMPDLKRHYEFPKAWSFRFLALLAVMTWWAARSHVKTYRNPFALPMAVWIMGAGMSVLAAANMAESLDALYIIDIVLAYFFISVAIDALSTVRHLRQAIYVIIVTGVIISFYGVLQEWGMDPWGLVRPPNPPVSFLGNQNYASYIHDMVLPLTIGYTGYLIHNAVFPVPQPVGDRKPLFTNKTLIERVNPFSFLVVLLYFLLGPYHMMACNCNGNKVGMMLTIYGVFWVVAIFVVLPRYFQMRELPEDEQKAVVRRRSQLQRLAVLGSVLFFVAASVIYGMSSDYVESLVKKKSGIFRRDVWWGSLQKTQDNVLLGIGPGNFKVIHPLYESQRERFVLGTEVLGRKAHSDYLEKTVEGGIFACLGVLWMVSICVWLLWSNITGVMKLRDRLDLGRAPPDKVYNLELFYRFAIWVTIGMIGAFICIGFHANLEAPLLQPGSMVIFVVLLAMLVTMHRLIRRSLLVGEEPANVTVTTARPKTWFGGLIPHWNDPRLRWALVPLVALFLFTPTMRHFLGEAFLRRGMGEHEATEHFRRQTLQQLNQARQAQRAGQTRDMNRALSQADMLRTTADQWNDTMMDSFERSLRLYPHYMETYYILGRYCIDQGSFHGKIEEAHRNLMMAGLNGDLQARSRDIVDRSRQLSRDGYEQGVEVLRTDIKMNPNYKWAHNNIGVCYDRLDDVNKARTHYYAALEVDPFQIYALFNLAIGYLKTEDYRAAIVKFTETLAVDPTKVEAYKFRAMAWESLCQEAPDEESLKRCRALWEEDVANYLERTRIRAGDAQLIASYVNHLISEDRLTEAAPFIQQLPELFGNSPRIMEQLSRHYVRSGQMGEAEKILEQMTKQFPRDAEAWYNLAIVRATQGVSQARHVWEALSEALIYDKAYIGRAREEPALKPFLDRPEFVKLFESME